MKKIYKMESKPEPHPLNHGKDIPQLLIAWISSNFTQTIKDDAINLIHERDNYGYKKYGQHLMSEDGRNTIEDARQELGDLLQYVFKAKINNEDISKIRDLLPILNKLIFEP